MSRLRWSRVVLRVDGRRYVDHVAASPDVALAIGQGFDEQERIAGRPWALHETTGGGLRWVGAFASVAEAKAHAEEMCAPRIPARRKTRS